jgi:hypothetical protein
VKRAIHKKVDETTNSSRMIWSWNPLPPGTCGCWNGVIGCGGVVPKGWYCHSSVWCREKRTSIFVASWLCDPIQWFSDGGTYFIFTCATSYTTNSLYLYEDALCCWPVLHDLVPRNYWGLCGAISVLRGAVWCCHSALCDRDAQQSGFPSELLIFHTLATGHLKKHESK